MTPARSDRRWAALGAAAITTLVVGGCGSSAASTSSHRFPETTGGVVHTWSDDRTAGGRPGPQLEGLQTVDVTCRLQGFKVQDGDTWWYRLVSEPGTGAVFYASADAFYNNGHTSGSLHGTPLFDPAVPLC